MTIRGHVHDGVVVLDNPSVFTEGTEVTVQPAASATANESGAESFVTRAHRLDRSGATDVALDLVYDAVDGMLRNGGFAKLDAILQAVAVSSLSADLLLGLLTATLPAKSRLVSRAKLFADIERELKNRSEYEEGLLTGLEG